MAWFTGIETRRVYEATAFIKQTDLAVIKTDKDFVNAVHNIATTSETGKNVFDIIAELEYEKSSLRVGLERPAVNPGPLKTSQLQLAQMKNELESMKEVGTELLKVREFVEKEEKRLKKMREIEEDLKSFVSFFELKSRLDKELVETDSKHRNSNSSKCCLR
jgi:hypothetical protein